MASSRPLLLPRVPDPATRAIYATALLLGTAYGVSIALTALRLNELGFTKPEIGSLAAVFGAGIVVASLPAAALMKRVSAKTLLVVALLGYAACVGLFPFARSGAALGVVRFLDGVFSVAAWIGFETVLLRRAEARHKAYVTSIYAITIALGYMVGPLLAKGIVAAASMRAAFLTSAGLSCAAALFVTVRLERAAAEQSVDAASASPGPASGRPGPSSGAVPLPALAVLRRIRTSLFGTFAYGYFQASVVLFLPLFLVEQKGISEARTILVPAFFAAGMLLFSNYAGRVGDRVGHLLVMRVLAAVGALMVAGFVWLPSWPLMCAAVFIAGATLASISPVSLALQGVVVDAASYGRANSIYNAFYAAGMLLGPPVSSFLYQRMGGAAMLWHLAALWASFVVFTMVFWRDDPAATRVRTYVEGQSIRE
jgi:MFS family permease